MRGTDKIGALPSVRSSRNSKGGNRTGETAGVAHSCVPGGRFPCQGSSVQMPGTGQGLVWRTWGGGCVTGA